MKILLLAPQPFYEERGTPIAINLLARSLAEQGHSIDLLCFAGKQAWSCKSVTVHYVKTLPKVSDIKPGFSVKKLYLDFFMFFATFKLLRANRYDVVHAVEESAFIALFFKPFFKYRFINDCDSSMVTQLIDKAPVLKIIERPLRFLESLPSRYADAVVPMCESLADDIRQYRSDNIFVLKDIDISATDNSNASGFDEDLRSLFNEPDAPLFMYIGNLESYQGIDLLLQSMSKLKQANCSANVVIIGGADNDIDHYRALSESLKLNDVVKLLGKRPLSGLAFYMDQADFLVSPRTQGSNTPMKIYSYLASHKPVLATRLLTHTQVMNDDVAYLVDPNEESFSQAMIQMATNQHGFSSMASQAAELIQREHSQAAFNKTVESLYAHIADLSAGA